MPLDRNLDDRLPPVRGESDNGAISVTSAEFTKTTRIDSGGMATVYEATIEDGPVDRVAIKEPDWDATVGRTAVETFVSEADTWQRVDDHPHIGTVYGSGRSPRPWLAMEYLGGGTLADRMPVDDPREALWIGSTVADGVQHAHHRGVAHLDLTPSNVLLDPTPDGTWDRPKIVDWGLATALDTDGGPDSLSPNYAAPEQMSGDDGRSVGPRTDIYQLGAVVYALLTGRPPERNGPVHSGAEDSRGVTPPSEIRDSLPSSVDSVVLGALASTPTDRVRTAAQFGEACAACFRELSAPKHPSESPASAKPTDTEPERDTDPAESPSTGTNPASTMAVGDGRSADGSDSDDTGPFDGATGTDRSTEWFDPDAYPEGGSRSVAEALRMETHPTADSLAAALRETSTRFDTETLGHRLSVVHSTERED